MSLENKLLSFNFPILLGDIGGTNARFSFIPSLDSEPQPFTSVRTADFEDINDAIRQVILDNDYAQIACAILAVAGPITADEIPLTNCDWIIRPKVMIEALGLQEVLIINDFEAQALGIASLDDDNRKSIGNAKPDRIASRVVVGPGTGLGVGALVYARGTWVPIPGEGGHIDLGPRTNRDKELFPHIETIGGRISAEQILCGRGLVNLYRAICKADNADAIFSDPADISTAGLSKNNIQAQEALALFCEYLGRVAGDIALIFMAKGGVYIAGGIPQKILPALEQSNFRAAFEDKAPHTALMVEIPTYVVTHPQAALAGLRNFTLDPNGFQLDLQDRHWSKSV